MSTKSKASGSRKESGSALTQNGRGCRDAQTGQWIYKPISRSEANTVIREVSSGKIANAKVYSQSANSISFSRTKSTVGEVFSLPPKSSGHRKK